MAIDVLVTGAGSVGGHAVEYLARRPEITTIAVIDRDADRARGIAWRATLGALQENRHVRIEGIGLDLADVQATADTIGRLAPRTIFHTATLLTVPEMARGLTPENFQAVREAGMGGFLAAHLTLGLSVQVGLKATGLKTSFITAPFPDFANQVLARTGPAPLTGIGNVDNIACELQAIVAEKLGVSALSVTPLVVAHHSVAEWFQRSGDAGKAPWHASVIVEGRDVTAEIDAGKLMGESAARIRGVPQESRTAASGVKTVLAALRDDGSFQHGAGPAGRPGGWPIRVWADHVEILPIPGLDEAEGLAFMLSGQRAGGIESIGDDGTVTATDACAGMVRSLFGVEVKKLAPGEIADAGIALRKALSKRIGNGG
ncbi:saccharopine dehydrogenase NADP-binding domain-containing protein [Martelella soudanensis]|uniref:saccharopine dehydrogenase NADP-binding domain-containing protein n=1 Tax=unclassified Martelella TaxID=2629616 RepID=UPI0015DF7F22|nr:MULTISPECIES: saccharopine dehydrogenase NADP-binding domain-containing protein [unclassified Martelella]